MKKIISTMAVILAFAIIIVFCLISVLTQKNTEHREKADFKQIEEVVTEEETQAIKTPIILNVDDEETIVELIKALESKLTAAAFAKEQRSLMTRKLRNFIKERDNFTCCNCQNSTHAEPNLLLEIDHIIPVAKGGCTTEDNLQTLCWKCNRAKSDKIIT